MKKFILLTLLLGGCASAPRLKDFNQISMGMSKAQVIDELGEPQTTRTQDGREILEYEAKDGDEMKPRLVVLEDREVVFFGRPSEYERQQTKAQDQGAQITTTVSPVISPTFTNNPVINITQAAPKALQTPAREPSEVKSWFHPAPTLEDVQNQGSKQ